MMEAPLDATEGPLCSTHEQRSAVRTYDHVCPECLTAFPERCPNDPARSEPEETASEDILAVTLVATAWVSTVGVIFFGGPLLILLVTFFSLLICVTATRAAGRQRKRMMRGERDQKGRRLVLTALVLGWLYILGLVLLLVAFGVGVALWWDWINHL